MKKKMESIQDLIEEAKVRTVWWGLCIFSVTYFLTHTSSSLWMNLPVAILMLYGLRILLNQIEFRWKPRQSQLSYCDKEQLSLNDTRLSTTPLPPMWKKRIDSPVVEAAMNDLIGKIINVYVRDLFYSSITPDKEVPELIRGVLMNALGEISVRLKEINIVDLLTRDLINLIGDHLEMFRRNQAAIRGHVMERLSSEERDERLKNHRMASGELYPALISPESEYKVLQKIVAGTLSVLLGPKETQCPLVRTIAREILTCLVVQPVLNLASPERINEVIEKFSGEEHSVNRASWSEIESKIMFCCRRIEKVFKKVINALKDSNFELFSWEEQSLTFYSVSMMILNFRYWCRRITEGTEIVINAINDGMFEQFSAKEQSVSQYRPKVKCRVLEGYFEKLSSKSSEVYYIEVTDTENKTWSVRRRYSKFERLHRQLKEIRNYNLQLPPKAIFSSSSEDAFVHSRCIQLDKYLQDLLSIANVAEHYEVWDFLSESTEWMPRNVSVVPILNLVEKVFQLDRIDLDLTDWARRKFVWICKRLLTLFMDRMEDVIDDCLLTEVYWLRNEETVAHGIRWAQDFLWPNGVTKVADGQEASDETDPSDQTFQIAGQPGGMKVPTTSSSEQQAEAARRARDIEKFLYNAAPKAFVSFVGDEEYRSCARDIFYFTQSNVCIKQLTYAILELLLQSVFPELQDLLRDIRKTSHSRPE